MNVESKDPWALTSEVLAEAQRVGKLIKERDEKIKVSTAACPTHLGKKGKFSHIAGYYPRLHPIYICPVGNHQFHVPD